jgi:hypothetical protein
MDLLSAKHTDCFRSGMYKPHSHVTANTPIDKSEYKWKTAENWNPPLSEPRLATDCSVTYWPYVSSVEWRAGVASQFLRA